MTISTDLYKAILSMDSYNRGYSPGIVGLNGTQLGSVTIDRDSSILIDPITKARLDQPSGFYAIAYQMVDGSKVISYRGTDKNFAWPWSDTGSDLWNGYSIGAGNPQARQW